MDRGSLTRWVQMKRSVGCGACGEVFETDASLDSACPRCGQRALNELDGGPGTGANAVMQAWMLRDTHTRTESVGLVAGAALGGVVGLVVAAVGASGAAMLLAGYLAVAGAFAGAAVIVPLLRRLVPDRPWVDREGARRTWLIALGAWAVVLPACLGTLWLVGGRGRLGPSLMRGVEVIWSKIIGG